MLVLCVGVNGLYLAIYYCEVCIIFTQIASLLVQYFADLLMTYNMLTESFLNRWHDVFLCRTHYDSHNIKQLVHNELIIFMVSTFCLIFITVYRSTSNTMYHVTLSPSRNHAVPACHVIVSFIYRDTHHEKTEKQTPPLLPHCLFGYNGTLRTLGCLTHESTCSKTLSVGILSCVVTVNITET